MLIISNFKDYYDSAIGVGGIDKTLVYQRKIEGQIDNTFKKHFKEFINYWDCCTLPCERWWNTREDGLSDWKPFLIGFCGKLYPGYELEYSNRTIQNPNGIKVKKLVFDFEKTIEILKYTPHNYNYKKIKEFFDLKNKENLTIFRDFHTPVFSFYFNNSKEITFLKNPCLKDYEFYKFFNSFQAHQEIEMFMGGVLGKPKKEIIEISEKDKLVQHGMDKWSFKNPDPPKRKQK